MRHILILMSIIFLCACGKCDCGETNTNNNQSVENKDEYYVKYTGSMSGGHMMSSPTITITIEDGSTQKFTSSSARQSLSRTIGPVRKGFTASISSNFEYNKIECCKNTGPFVIKAEKRGSCSYTIDF